MLQPNKELKRANFSPSFEESTNNMSKLRSVLSPSWCCVILFYTICFSEAFVPQSPSSSFDTRNSNFLCIQKENVARHAAAGGGLFGGLFGGGGQELQDGPKTIIDLPANTVKVGALRFFLQIYLVGEQNKPTQGSWVLNTNSENANSLEMYYKDGTGMFSVDLTETNVSIRRHGQRPSLEYMLQESVMLHGVLDELNTIAFETDDIDADKRLLQFPSDDAINEARDKLPARKD